MEAFGRSFTDTFQAVLAIAFVGVFAIWWWVFYLLFALKKENVGRAAFMMMAFLCLICEMARIIDPFGRWNIWSNEALRTYLTVELLLMLTLLLIAADAASWLSYFSAESLLLKPQRRYRHSIYVGIILLVIESIILVAINTFNSKYTRGVTIGWLLSALILVLIGLFTMVKSLREVEIAVKLEQNTDLDEVRNELFFESEHKEEEEEKKSTSRKKCIRLAKYLSCIGCLFIADLCFGGSPSAGEIDLMHLLYDIVLKIILVTMLIHRRPVKVARAYEIDIHQKYKPFDQTLFSGCDATRTVFNLQEMVRKKTAEVLNDKKMLNALDHAYDDISKPKFLDELHERTPSTTVPLQGVEMTQLTQHTEEGLEDVRVRPPKEVSGSKKMPQRRESESRGTKGKHVIDLRSEALIDEHNKRERPVERVRKSRVYFL